MSFCLEVLKLVLQCAGALLVTWLGVRFALDRYKREKMWEKHVNLYGDIISSYRKLMAVLGRWRPHFSGDYPMKDKERETLVVRYQDERDRLFDALSLGLVVLPKDQAEEINKTLGCLSRPVEESANHLEALDAELKALSDGLLYIIPLARKAAGNKPYD